MTGYVIKRLDQGGGYVARPGSASSYTRRLEDARVWATREEAERELCVENEVIVPLDQIFSRVVGSGGNNHGHRDVWSEDPEHPVADWQYAVANSDTRLGYWDWVGGDQLPLGTDGPEPERLARHYGHWGEHPGYPVADWQYQVANGDTRRGYWAWVAAEIESAGGDRSVGRRRRSVGTAPDSLLDRARALAAQLREAAGRGPRSAAVPLSALQREGRWDPRHFIGDPAGDAQRLERAIRRFEQAEAGLQQAYNAVNRAAPPFAPPSTTGRRRRRVVGSSKSAYQVAVDPRAEKAMDKLRGDLSDRVVSAVAQLADVPRSSTTKRITQTEKWSGYPHLFMARVGKLRILYWIDDTNRTVTIVDVVMRKDLPGGTNGRR